MIGFARAWDEAPALNGPGEGGDVGYSCACVAVIRYVHVHFYTCRSANG